MTFIARGVEATSACNGVTTAFGVAFQFLEASDLLVYLQTTVSPTGGVTILLTEGTHYTLSGSGPAGTAVVTTTLAYAAGFFIRRLRQTALGQGADFVANDGIGAEKLETALDRAAMVAEETDAAIAVVAAGAFLGDLGAAQLAAQRAMDARVAADADASAAAISAINAGLSAAAVLALQTGLFPDTATALSKGVIGTASLVAGSGGTNGQFDVAFSGGGGSGAAARFVVAGGALVAPILITAKGSGYTSAPTLSFGASTGLTGASATAVIGQLAPPGAYFAVAAADNVAIYLNAAGTPTLKETIPNVVGLATINDNATLTLGRDLDDAAIVNIGNTAWTSAPGDSVGNSFIYDAGPWASRGKLKSITGEFAGDNPEGIALVLFDPVLGREIVVSADVRDLGAQVAGEVKYTFDPPLDVEKGGGAGFRPKGAYNVKFRAPNDNGARVILHGWGPGVVTPGDHFIPIVSGSSPALSVEFESVADNVEDRLQALEAPRRVYASPYSERVLINETFNALPSSSAWTFSGGSWTSDGTGITGPAGGLSTYAVSNIGPSSIARRILELDIHSPSVADIAGQCTLPIATTNYGGVQLLVDRVAGKLRLYSWNAAGSAGTLAAEIALASNVGVMDLRLVAHKDNFDQALSLVDKATGKVTPLPANHSDITPFFLALFHGSMGVASRAGAARFDNFKVSAPYAARPVCAAGDSLFDGSGILKPGEETFINLAARGRNDLVVAGRSGDTTTNFMLRKQADMFDFNPSGIILGFGTNEIGAFSTWEANYLSLIASANAIGAWVALVIFPSMSAAQKTAVRNGLGQNYTVDIAAAVTVGQDGVTMATGTSNGDPTPHLTGWAHRHLALPELYRAIPRLAA